MEDIYVVPTIEFNVGEFKGVPVLYYEYSNFFRKRKHDWIFHELGLYIYRLRHSDDGNWVVPVTIERHVVVNYCGFIVSHIDLFKEFKELVVDDEYIPIESEDEGYDLIGCSDESMTIDLYLIYVAELQAAKND